MKSSGLFSRAAFAIGLPGDIIKSLPSVTLEGNTQMTVDNHKGIVQFSDTILKVRTAQGSITVFGKGFVIEGIASDALVLRGEIKTIEYA